MEVNIAMPEYLSEMVRSEEKEWAKHSIYKLPASCVTEQRYACYKPSTVSLGPYHHEEPKLKSMESHKIRVLHRFLERSGKSMKTCVAILKRVARDLMDAYNDLDPKWEENGDEFLELMIRDGCFMLEILRYYRVEWKYPELDPLLKDQEKQYAVNDPIFSRHGSLNMIPYIRRDMMMLENQLPLLLLTLVYSFEQHQDAEENQPDDYTMELLIDFCAPSNVQKINFKDYNPTQKESLKGCKHILDVHRQMLILGKPSGKSSKPSFPGRSLSSKLHKYLPGSTKEPSVTNILPSATRLQESGIKIESSKNGGIGDISFQSLLLGGILTIPRIVVDDNTEIIFLNLIAFERFHVGVDNDVTSYISFMDDIIDNKNDVYILEAREIVENAFGSAKAVAELFNTLSKDTTIDSQSTIYEEQGKAKVHCQRQLNKWWGELIHTYFINPWSGIALIAAILLFGLGITGTVFSILNDSKK